MEKTLIKPKTKLGRKLLRYLALRGLTRTEFAAIWGYSRSGFHKILVGDVHPKVEQMKKLVRISDGFFDGNDLL